MQHHKPKSYVLEKDPLLSEILQKVVKEYSLKNTHDYQIGWAKLEDSTWACYLPESRSILVNVVFKNWQRAPKLPSSLLDYLIYHEVLHDLYPPISKNGKQYDHHKEFKRFEKKFKEYKQICQWETLEFATRTSKKFAKFGTSEYRDIFCRLTGLKSKTHLNYFHQLGEPTSKWCILGVDPARKKYFIQAIRFQDSQVAWFHHKQCVWE